MSLLLRNTESLGFPDVPLTFLRTRYLIFCLLIAFVSMIFYFLSPDFSVKPVSPTPNRQDPFLKFIYQQPYPLSYEPLHPYTVHLCPCMAQAYATHGSWRPPDRSTAYPRLPA